MIRTMLTFTLAVATLPAFPRAQSVAAASLPSDSDVRQMLVDRIDLQHQSVGVVVGLVGPKGRRVIAYGHPEKNDPRPVNGETVFEIGSITKVFTSLLLADMVQRGDMRLDDPVATYLPANVHMPERNGRAITLVDLATHTSGLPPLPSNFTPKDPTNPYADYTVDQLYQFLATYQLTREIGSRYEYSNLGAGLLGHALTRRTGLDYEALVRSRIADPLDMHDTRVALTPEMKRRLAAGHDAAMATVSNWDVSTLAGAGALRSTTNDLLTFVAANLGYVTTPLAPAMAAMLTMHRPTGQAGRDVALAWHISTTNGKEIVWHNGGTGGYRSFMGFDPKTRVGVVVLSNASTTAGVDDIGLHLLDSSLPLMKPAQVHQEAPVDPKVFDASVGRYQLAPGAIMTVTRVGDHRFVQLTGQPQFEVFPESERDYFLKVVDAQISFVTDATGRATELVLHQNGRDQHAPRIEGDAPTPKVHTEVPVDPKIFDGYVGRYQLVPTVIMTVTRQDNRLFAQLTGQQAFEILPEGDREYFLKAVNAQLTFMTDKNGRATEVILHQNGRDQHATRIE